VAISLSAKLIDIMVLSLPGDLCRTSSHSVVGVFPESKRDKSVGTPGLEDLTKGKGTLKQVVVRQVQQIA